MRCCTMTAPNGVETLTTKVNSHEGSVCNTIKAAIGSRSSSDHSSGHLSILGKGRFDQHVGHQASVGQLVPGDRREGAALQPMLDGSALIRVPISCNHWIHHCHLHTSSLRSVLNLLHAAGSFKQEVSTETAQRCFCWHGGSPHFL